MEVANRAQRQEGRAVESEQDDDADPGEHRVCVEEIPEAPGIVAVRVDWRAVEESSETDAPHEGGAGAADRVRPHPDGTPTWRLALRAPLERDDADDQEEEDE